MKIVNFDNTQLKFNNYLNQMKKTFAVGCLALAMMTPTAQAANLSFLDTPYEFLDEVVMTFYKPLIWVIVIGWSQSFACGYIMTQVLNAFVTEDTLTDTEKSDICSTGIEMYWEQFFYGGAIGNQPYDLAWSWSSS